MSALLSIELYILRLTIAVGGAIYCARWHTVAFGGRDESRPYGQPKHLFNDTHLQTLVGYAVDG